MQTAAEQTTKMDQTLQWTAPEVLKPLPFAKLIPLMQAAVNAAPRRTDLQLKLAKAYFHTDRMADLIDLLAPALHLESTDAEALFYLGRAYLSIQNDQLAIEALSRAASQGIIHAFGFLAEAFERLGRHDGALKASLDGLFLSPTDYKAFGMATRALLMRREKSRLWDLCTDLNNRGAWAAYVPSAMALVANTLAAEDQVMRLIDPPAWFSARRLDVTKDFNQALAAELLAQMPPSPLPSTQATVGTGRRIDQLQVVAGPLATQLLSNIKDAVEDYFAERSTLTHHPMIAQRPHSITLHPWALAVQGEVKRLVEEAHAGGRIARATGNSYFTELYGGLAPRLVPRARLDLFKNDPDGKIAYLQRIQQEHDQIYQAIGRGDSDPRLK